MSRNSTLFMGLLGLLVCGVASPVQAQVAKKGNEFIPGKVSSIEKDKTGRNYLLKIEDSADGEILSITVLAKTPLLVTAPGDEAFIQPGVTISTKVVQAQMNYFGGDFTVYTGIAPPPSIKPDPQDRTVFEITGKVQKLEMDGFWVSAGGPPQKIMYEEGEKTITVKISDPLLIKEGDEVEVEGKMIAAKKTIMASMVNVTSKEPLTAAAYFAELEERKKSAKASKTKTPKSKAAETGAGESADPFGVLGGKKKDGDKKSDDEMEEKPSDKKPADKKGTTKE